MSRRVALLTSGVLLIALLVVSLFFSLRAQECRDWQDGYRAIAGDAHRLVPAGPWDRQVLRRRPDGCEVPDVLRSEIETTVLRHRQEGGYRLRLPP